jgi:cysteine desulfuration protein SufE
MTIKETQEEIISEFAVFDDWLDKYNHLIELGKKLPPLDQKLKTEDNLIRGCQLKVWFHSTFKDN